MNIRLCFVRFSVSLTFVVALAFANQVRGQESGSATGSPGTLQESASAQPPTSASPSNATQSAAAPAADTAAPASADPIVAKIDLTLKLKDQVIDTINKGDLLTVVQEREKDYVILTSNGKKGAIAKENAAKLNDSLPVFDELILQAPEEGRLYTLRAGTHWAMGNEKKALADFDKAIELGYTAPHAYASRGMFHAKLHNFDEAIADFTKAIEADPKDEVSLMNRASVFMQLGYFPKAADDYTAALSIRKENPLLYSQRAVAYKLQGKLEEAVKDYDKAIALVEKDISAWMGRGFVKFQLGQHQAAIDDFSKVIELAPQSAVAFNNRGFNYQQIKQFKKAAEDYQRAMELAPRYVLALQNRAWLLATCEESAVRDPVAAIEIAKTINEISEFKDISDLTLLGAAFAAAGEFETAVGWQEKALAIASTEQKVLAEKILALYQDKKELDPAILEQSQSDASASKDDSKPAEPPKPETDKAK